MPTSNAFSGESRSSPRGAKPRGAAGGGTTCSALRPLRWLQSLLKRRLRLERRGLQIHVLLDPAPADVVAVPASAGEVLRRAHGELRALLDRHADARRTLRHLSYIERALAQSGSRALEEVPVPVLRKGLEQLNQLAIDAAGADLAPLRKRLEAAVRGRPRDRGEATRPQELHVSEASHSLFDKVERHWTGQIPLEESPAPDKRGA